MSGAHAGGYFGIEVDVVSVGIGVGGTLRRIGSNEGTDTKFRKWRCVSEDIGGCGDRPVVGGDPDLPGIAVTHRIHR
jgi:hypothetical protein